MIETDTFAALTASRPADYGLQERTLELGIAAARLARRTADRFGTPKKPRFVAGSISPSGKLISATTLKCPISADALAEIFRRRQVNSGRSGLIAQANGIFWRSKAAIEGASTAPLRRRYYPAHSSPGNAGYQRKMRRNRYHCRLAITGSLGVSVIGLNCSYRSGAHAGLDPVPKRTRRPAHFLHPQRRADER